MGWPFIDNTRECLCKCASRLCIRQEICSPKAIRTYWKRVCYDLFHTVGMYVCICSNYSYNCCVHVVTFPNSCSTEDEKHKIPLTTTYNNYEYYFFSFMYMYTKHEEQTHSRAEASLFSQAFYIYPYRAHTASTASIGARLQMSVFEEKTNKHNAILGGGAIAIAIAIA